MLDEADVFEESLRYFKDFVGDGQAELYIVTSDREYTINEPGSERDTVRLAAMTAAQGDAKHVHLPDATGHKSDQVNLAATVAAQHRQSAGDCLVVIYDVDSRPDVRSLEEFRAAASKYPNVNVFHQSARFEMRAAPRTFGERIADAGALRLNRFVLSTEMPRLLARRPDAGRLRSLIAKCTYGHVTGHGLCVRLSFLLRMPLPARRMVEDMHWGFLLAVQGEPVVPVPCLDRSDVPGTATQQFLQWERWFLGPARAVSYAQDPRTPRGCRRVILAVAALCDTAEWLSAALALPAVAYSIAGKRGITRASLRLFSAAILAELLVAEATLGEGRLARRAQRVALYPFAVTGFGAAGWLSIARLAVGRRQRHKTRHAPSTN